MLLAGGVRAAWHAVAGAASAMSRGEIGARGEGGPRGGGRFSSGDAGRAVHTLGEIGELIESGRFTLPVAQTFPLAEVAEAHRVSEQGRVRGKLVLLIG